MINRIVNYFKSMLLGLCIFRNGQVFKNFRFNYVIDQKSNQADVYNVLRIDVIFRLWCRILFKKL